MTRPRQLYTITLHAHTNSGLNRKLELTTFPTSGPRAALTRAIQTLAYLPAPWFTERGLTKQDWLDRLYSATITAIAAPVEPPAAALQADMDSASLEELEAAAAVLDRQPAAAQEEA